MATTDLGALVPAHVCGIPMLGVRFALVDGDRVIEEDETISIVCTLPAGHDGDQHVCRAHKLIRWRTEFTADEAAVLP